MLLYFGYHHIIHTHLTSCTHLKGVARRFNIPAATEKIEKYYQFVNEFCQHKLTQHIYMKPFLTAKPTILHLLHHHLQIALEPSKEDSV